MIGTVGVPAKYGGFETLLENLITFHSKSPSNFELVVYCSSKAYTNKSTMHKYAKLRYVNLRANGPWSMIYDALCIYYAVYKEKVDVVLVLGVSGAYVLPLVKRFSNVRIVCNIDGIEWKREKWGIFTKYLLRALESIAVNSSDVVVSDNTVIMDYVTERYGVNSKVIAYGGDHVLQKPSAPFLSFSVPDSYFFTVCRIERENNLELILEGFSYGLQEKNIVIVGNWQNSTFGRALYEKYHLHPNIYLLSPIYDVAILRKLREDCNGYIHGHSAGGTNPSLVEAMWFGKPIFAFNCLYNIASTEGKARYFADADELVASIKETSKEELSTIASAMSEIAHDKYCWDAVAEKYFEILK